MAVSSRLTPDELAKQRAITFALDSAHSNRLDDRRYRVCVDFAARRIDTIRRELDLVDRSTDRAWRD